MTWTSRRRRLEWFRRCSAERARYGLDEEDMRALGSRLADAAGERSAENLEFAGRFFEEHRETFDRLAK